MMPPEFGGFLLILNPELIAGAEYAPHIADWISAARVPARAMSHPLSTIDAERSSRFARAPGSGSRR